MSTWYCNKCNTSVTTVTAGEGTSHFHCPGCNDAVDAHPELVKINNDMAGRLAEITLAKITKEVITEHEDALKALGDDHPLYRVESGGTEFIWQQDVRDLTAAVRELTKAVAALLPQTKPKPAEDTDAKSDPN